MKVKLSKEVNNLKFKLNSLKEIVLVEEDANCYKQIGPCLIK